MTLIFPLNDSDNSDTWESYEDLVISSSSPEQFVDIISSSIYDKDVNLNIDFSSFKNHVFFGSAVSKLENFKTKVIQIEDYLTEISRSLGTPTSGSQNSTHIINLRKDYFSKIRNVTNNFTPYEKYMYYDNQLTTTSSAPGLGKNLASNKPIFQGDTTNTQTDLTNFDGFNVVYKHTSIGSGRTVNIFKDNYKVQNSPFFNSNNSVYLSFLMKSEGAQADPKLTLTLQNRNLNHVPELPSDAFGVGHIFLFSSSRC